MRERVSAIVAIILLAFLIGASYFYAVQSGLKDLKYLPSENSPDYTATKLSLTDFDGAGNPVRRVIADKVIHYSDDRTDADHPRYITLTPNKPQVDASSDRGWTHDAGKTIEFEGNVKILRDPAGSTPAGSTPALSFETQKMTAFPDTERFTSDSPVVFHRGSDSTTASGMDYSYANGTISLTGRVNTHIASRK